MMHPMSAVPLAVRAMPEVSGRLKHEIRVALEPVREVCPDVRPALVASADGVLEHGVVSEELRGRVQVTAGPRFEQCDDQRLAV